MNNLNCVISCPIDTYSGYGSRSRDLVKALIKAYPEWNISLLSQRWGNTRAGYLLDHNELDLKSRIIPTIKEQPDIWFQITVPNEFQKIGKFSIGVTAGIETNACDPSWLDGCNRMDLVLTSSEHAKQVFLQTRYESKNKATNQLEKVLSVDKPVEVLFEGLDTTKYFKIEEGSTKIDLSEIKESFCFLTVGHWMQGDVGHDRKNIGYTIKAFLETFKNKPNPPALILKTQIGNTSIGGKERLIDRIHSIRKTVKGSLPNIYVVYGDLSDEDMNHLYNHPKVKAYVTFTKGEGFGRPLLEFSSIGKPIIATSWSGHVDFLHKEHVKMVGGQLEKVHPTAVVKNILIPESSWFKPNDSDVGFVLKDLVKNYKNYIPSARKQRRYVLDNFTFEYMVDKVKQIIDSRLPEIPRQVEAVLPPLKLPKLKKID